MSTETVLTVSPKPVNGNHAEFVVAGEIDAATHHLLRDALVAAVEGGANDLVVDMSDVTFMDSSGLRGIVESIRLGASVTLRHLRPAVQQVFDIVTIRGITIEG